MNITFTLTADGQAPFTVAVPIVSSRKWTRTWHRLGPLGIHFYQRMWPGGAIECARRISNGCVKPDGTGHPGRVYYSDLTMRFDAWDGVSIHSLQPNVFNIAQGGGHVFPPRAILEHRFVILPRGAEVSLAKRILKFKWVRFPSYVHSWGPSREAMPTINRGHYSPIYNHVAEMLAAAMADGQQATFYPFGTQGSSVAYDLQAGAMGPSIPDGFAEAGAPAGYGIDLAFGWQQCAGALEYAALAHSCSMARNRVACYHADTGEIIRSQDWANNFLAHPQLMKGEAHQDNELPGFLIGDYSNYKYRNFNQGFSPYQAQLEAYKIEDTGHVVRALRHPAALVGWAYDMMAQDDIDLLFEYHRTMWFSTRADDKSHSTDGTYVPRSLSAEAYSIGLNPGHGAYVLRDFGWVMMLGAWATLKTAELAWREKALETYYSMLDVHGLPERRLSPHLPPDWLGTQHFHSAIIHAGAWALCRASDQDEGTLLEGLALWRDEILLNPNMPLQKRLDAQGSYGPAHWIGVQKAGSGQEPPLSTAATWGGGFQEHVLAVLGRAALSEIQLGDYEAAKEFLRAGIGIDAPSLSVVNKLQSIRGRTGYLDQFAHYWAAAERIPNLE